MFKGKCEQCTSWLRIGATQGECRKRAPVPSPYKDAGSGELLVRPWPVTEWVDWCGDFEKLPAGQKTA